MRAMCAASSRITATGGAPGSATAVCTGGCPSWRDGRCTIRITHSRRSCCFPRASDATPLRPARQTVAMPTDRSGHEVARHDGTGRRAFVPAMGADGLLPLYDLVALLGGARSVYRSVVTVAELRPGVRVLEVGCGTGN